jgi:hypothetical protein
MSTIYVPTIRLFESQLRRTLLDERFPIEFAHDGGDAMFRSRGNEKWEIFMTERDYNQVRLEIHKLGFKCNVRDLRGAIRFVVAKREANYIP